MAAIPIPLVGPVISAVTGGSPADVAASITPVTAVAKDVSDVSGGPFSAISGAIGSTLDLLKLMAWLFDPKNWLRVVEFMTGLILMGFGLWAALQGFGERRERYVPDEDVVSRSGLGRVARALADNESGSRRPRSAPHVQRRQARRRGMEAAAGGRAPKRASGGKTKTVSNALKKTAKAVPK